MGAYCVIVPEMPIESVNSYEGRDSPPLLRHAVKHESI